MSELGGPESDLQQGNRSLRARVSDMETQFGSSGPGQQEWLRVTLSSIGDAVLAADTAGRITFLNKVAVELTGWSEEEALGRPIREVFRVVNEKTREEAEDIVARVLRAAQVVELANDTALVTRDGREIPIEDSAAPIRDAAGNMAGVVLVFHDVTEKRRAQEALRQSERRVRLKLESILSPEGDIGQLDLRDVIDSQAIQSLMEDFYHLTGIPTAIIDSGGNVLVGVGWQDVCTMFHRVHPESRKHCIESDTLLTAGIGAGEFRLYKCKNNLWDVATPIMVGDRHAGNLFTGQFLFEDEPFDREVFLSQARRYGFHEEEYLAALALVPRIKRESVDAGMAFLAKLGQMISRLSYSNLKLARSISERDFLMASLRESADRLNRTQEIAHLGSWELDLVKNRLSWSDEVYRIFGLKPQEFGATYEAFLAAVHPDDRAVVNDAYSRSLREGRDYYDIVHRVVRRDTGEVRWVHEKCDHIRDERGGIVRSIGMVQDITEQRRNEQALRESQKLESVGVLAGGIAHDFNNLLTSILGNASLLQAIAPEDMSAELQSIVDSSEKAASLTRQLLAYAGKGSFEISDFDVARLVRSSAGLFRVSIPKSIDLRLDMSQDLPPVRGDASQIQQVVMNLVINAAEAIPRGQSGEVSVSTGFQDLDEAAARSISSDLVPGRHVFVSVRDNGCGMDEDTKAKIFDPFFTTKFTGRGLGLAAVQGILRSHKGTIAVETSPGQGSTFTVYLPCIGPLITEARREEGPARKSSTVLVVDDEEAVRDFTKAALERVGHRVRLAENGRQALEVLHANGDVDLVLLDVVMPQVGGAEAFSEMRKRWPKLPVLVASGYSRQQAQSLGIPDALPFIEKPYTAQTLAGAINKALAFHSRKQPGEE